MLKRRRWLAAAAAILLVCAAGYAVARSMRATDAPERIVITTRPILSFDLRDPSRQRFGALEFRGGLDLTSPSRAFGEISAIRLDADGARFIAVSDRGSWLRGRIVYDGTRPAAIADAEIAPILGADGRPLAARGWHDAESIAQDGGTLYVGLERVQQIVRFDYGRDGLLARGTPIPVPPDFATLDHNKSLECLAIVPPGLPGAGTLIAVTEHSLDKDGNHRAFLLKGAEVGRFAVKRSDGFDVSDCEVLAPAGFLLLERRYSLARGPAIRIRRLQLSQLVSDALVDGAVLMEADLGQQIDNMEGIALHRNARGETIVTIISDNNFALVQRTLLLQFALVGE